MAAGQGLLVKKVDDEGDPRRILKCNIHFLVSEDAPGLAILQGPRPAIDV